MHLVVIMTFCLLLELGNLDLNLPCRPEGFTSIPVTKFLAVPGLGLPYLVLLLIVVVAYDVAHLL